MSEPMDTGAAKSEAVQGTSEVGLIGLGVMGANLALNMVDSGFVVSVWNRHPEGVRSFVSENPGKSLRGFEELGAFVMSLAKPRRVILMVKAGSPVDEVIELLKPLLETGDIIVDGGNSWFEDTRTREAALVASGLWFIGVGISGGEEGARHGPSIMPGGSPAAYARMAPVFEAIAARTDEGPCVTHVGADGAGHFVKMVHNGIEYADMQLIAEAYDICRRVLGMTAPEIGELFAEWNQGPLSSFLVELTGQVLRVREPKSGHPMVDLVLDKAGQKGTGRWTVQSALTLGVPVPSIAAAVDARLLSSMKEERICASRRIGPPVLSDVPSRKRSQNLAGIHDALLASKVVSYAQGMALIQEAGKAYGWTVDLAEVARIWKGGCIIRARLLDPISNAFVRQLNLTNLLLDATFDAYTHHTSAGWRDTLAHAVSRGVPTPAMSASLAYYDAYRSAELPQNLTQAQRDAFGAHTYQRVDHPEWGFVHSEW